MENLINFDVEAKAAPSSPPVLIPCLPKVISIPKVVISEPALVPGQIASDLNNPFDIINHKANFADDPFEFTKRTDERNFDELMDGSQFSFDCFSNTSSIDSSHALSSKESSLSSAGSQKTVVSRSQSDSSTISSKSNVQSAKANVSVDNIQPKNQLLKLSFLNSPNSPMKRSTNKTVVESSLAEARRIAKHFAEPSDLSFEDLNNVSQPVTDISDSSMVDTDLRDLQAMKVDVLKGNHLPPSTPSTMNADKIAMFQERLRLIKKEDPDELELSNVTEHTSTPVKVKAEESHEEKGEESEVDQLLQKLKSIITDGNKNEAKIHINRLNELLEKRKDPKEAKNTLHVQPIVRQDTFEIDDDGSRKYKDKSEEKDEKVEIINKLNELLKSLTVDVHQINLGQEDASLSVYVVPTPVSTPVKNPRHSVSVAPKAFSALKAMETRKLGTPMKRQSIITRSSTFTTPRPMTTSKAVHPYEQKANVQTRVGAVRKSLLSTIEKTPQVVKPRESSITKPAPKPAPATAPRRSVSMRASIPAVQVSKATPMKNVPRPSTGAPYAASAATRRLSQAPATMARPTPTAASRVVQPTRSRTVSEKKPVPQFKPPSGLRKVGPKDDKGSLV